MDLGIRVRVWSRITFDWEEEGGDGWSWEAFTPGDVAQRPPLDQRSGGAKVKQLAGMDPTVQCCSLLLLRDRQHRCEEAQIEASSFFSERDPSGPRSSWSGSSSFLLSCDPPMKKGARSCACSPRGACSPVAMRRRWRGGEERCGAVAGGRERERGAVNRIWENWLCGDRDQRVNPM
jgi:hypothetical protein